MTHYLITFPGGGMDHISEDELPEVGKEAHAVVQEMVDAGVFVLGGGVDEDSRQVVGTDGAVSDGPFPNAIGGIVVVDVPSHEEAVGWAARIAAACRCPQEVRALGEDPELDEMLERRGAD